MRRASRRIVLVGGLLLFLGDCSPPAGGVGSDGGSREDSAVDAGSPDAVGPVVDGGGDRDVVVHPDVCEDVVDLVLVLDVSSSMRFVLDELEAQIGSVVTACRELADDPHFGLVAFVDNHRLDDSGDAEGGVVHTGAETLQAAFRTYREVYTQPNRNPGDGPDGPTTQNPICEENALDALHAAAADFPWRETATRVVILATDDTFLERPDNYGDRDGDGLTDRTDFPREGDYPALTTVPETVEALQEARVRVFSWTRLRPPGLFDPSRCGTGRRLQWQDVSDGWTTPYGENAPIPEVTDARNFDIEAVRRGELSLTATINEVVVDSYCHEPIY